MSCIKDISLISNRQGILPVLSSLLLVPSSVRRVLIAGRQGSTSQDVSSTLQRACTNIPSPKVLHLDHVFTPRDQRTYSMFAYALNEIPPKSRYKAGWGWDTNTTAITLRLLPSPHIEPSPEVKPYTFPASLINPTNWLFSALRRIILSCSFPLPFWKALARVPTLEAIEHTVTHFDDAFCRTLEEAVESDQVGANDGKCFPALIAICTTFQQKDLPWDVEYSERLAIALIRNLRRKGIPYFAWLDFYGCRTHIDADTLRLLFSVSREVWWTVAI
ncbi:hypothetical protein D9611_012789 [Ephemerocybe angulata]|uniref:Uncharacterized protein n=1 Tax=Ephemerocybe angulata TaxID=980116 RepID=A0A8H5FJ18_9AGAR|nr:hypothetical protein D9611_012789 [Tulosesus angulatus]